jgi:hypothetical protein
VLTLVTAEGDPIPRVVAVLDRPLSHGVGHRLVVNAIKLAGPVGRVAIGRVKEDGAGPR